MNNYFTTISFIVRTPPPYGRGGQRFSKISRRGGKNLEKGGYTKEGGIVSKGGGSKICSNFFEIFQNFRLRRAKNIAIIVKGQPIMTFFLISELNQAKIGIHVYVFKNLILQKNLAKKFVLLQILEKSKSSGIE